jgi:repressor LexA
LRFAFPSLRVLAREDGAMMTRRQKEMFDYLRAYIAENGYAPTLEEIGRHFDLASLATVHKHLQNLERKGVIRRLPNQSRALELAVAPDARAVTVPLLGRVAAGTPIEPVEEPETVTLPEELLGRGETFALRVRGDSMIDEGILDGDLVVVEARPDAVDGATVVALVRGEATVKKLYRERGDRVRLMPANERVAPIVAPADEVEIRGEVIAVLRRYR